MIIKNYFLNFLLLICFLFNFKDVESQMVIVVDHIGQQGHPIDSFYLFEAPPTYNFIDKTMRIHLTNRVNKRRTIYDSLYVNDKILREVDSLLKKSFNNTEVLKECQNFGSFQIRVFKNENLINNYLICPREKSLTFFNSFYLITNNFNDENNLSIYILKVIKRLKG